MPGSGSSTNGNGGLVPASPVGRSRSIIRHHGGTFAVDDIPEATLQAMSRRWVLSRRPLVFDDTWPNSQGQAAAPAIPGEADDARPRDGQSTQRKDGDHMLAHKLIISIPSGQEFFRNAPIFSKSTIFSSSCCLHAPETGECRLAWRRRAGESMAVPSTTGPTLVIWPLAIIPSRRRPGAASRPPRGNRRRGIRLASGGGGTAPHRESEKTRRKSAPDRVAFAVCLSETSGRSP